MGHFGFSRPYVDPAEQKIRKYIKDHKSELTGLLGFEVQYSGGNDEGFVDDVVPKWDPSVLHERIVDGIKRPPVRKPLPEELVEMCDDLMPDGFGTGEGSGSGTVTYDLATDKFVNESSWNHERDVYNDEPDEDY